jgi:hypothetical protein
MVARLRSGTAVLVDKFGKPVARCRCGNPLKEPVFVPTATCLHCPANYKPPPPCKYRRDPGYDEEYESHEDYDRAYYRSRSSRNPCYTAYPEPPSVTVITVYRPTPAQPPPEEPQPPPEEPQPEPGLNCEAPRSQLEAERCAERQNPQPQPEEPQPEPQQPTGPACSDGIDNDSGGEIDYPNDSGCSSPDDPSEE